MTTTVTTSNTCSGLNSKYTRWSMRVSAELDVLSGVTMKLHPTFQPDTVELTRQADGSFESGTFSGWGTFPVHLVLTLKSSGGKHDRHSVVHELSFERPLTSFAHNVPFDEPQSTGGVEASDVQMDDSELSTTMAANAGPSAAELTQRLRETPSLRHDDQRFWHGRAWPLGEGAAPRATWVSDGPPRADHGDKPSWLTATEWEDSPAVLQQKLAMLAALLRSSKKTVLYTGAGISVSAGIGQAAKGSAKQGRSWANAEPTPTHFAAGVLAKHGLAHGWVQQNHDGLPQKAGWPQERINEVHGSWFDPSNPVVKYSGSLMDELYEDMVEQAETAELVLVMGTSLSGLNADQMALKAARRAGRGGSGGGGSGGAGGATNLGFVMINLQQTEHDGEATLKINARSDDVLRQLLPLLGLAPLPARLPAAATAFASVPSRVRVPYDASGRRLPEDAPAASRHTWLDLRDGAAVKLTAGHNVQGAQQPGMMHIGAEGPTRDPRTGAVRPPAEGVGRVVRRDAATCSIVLDIEGVPMRLGVWWLESAMRGALSRLPIVNVTPKLA